MSFKKSWRSDVSINRPDAPHSTKVGWLLLFVWISVAGIVWLIVLPWLGAVTPLCDRIEWEKARGINPDAVFYTDLELMDTIIDSFHRKAHRAK